MRNPKKLFVWTIVGVLVLALGGYIYFETRTLILGPEIIVTEPRPGARISSEATTVAGIARNISEITLNGRPIFINEAGEFRETVLLAKGYSVLELRVRDRFGREQRKTVEVVYTPEPRPDEERATTTPASGTTTSPEATIVN